MPSIKSRESSLKESLVSFDKGFDYGSVEPLLGIDAKDKGKEGKTKIKKVSLRDLYRFATPLDGFLIICGLLFSIISGAGWPVTSLVFGGMTNTFLTAQNTVNQANVSSLLNALKDIPQGITMAPALKGDLQTISAKQFEDNVTQYSVYYVYVALAVFVASAIFTDFWGVVSVRQMDRIRKEFFRAILRQEVAWFDERLSGELTARLSDDLDRIKEGIGDKMGILFQCLAQFIAGYVIAFTKSWKLTLIMVSLMPLVVLTAALMSKLVSRSSTQEQNKYSAAGGVAEEVIGCIRTVVSFSGQSKEVNRYQKALEEGKKLGVRKGLYTGLNLSFMFLVVFSSYALAFWYGSVMISNHEIERGNVFVVFMCVLMGSFALGNMGPQLGVLAIAQGAASTIFEIIDNIFQDIAFDVEPGQKIALVGPSGCGKSTVVNLLMRFYDPLRGKILLDGHDLRSLNLNWLRNFFGIVSQEPILFGSSIRENIRLGKPEATDAEMKEACKQANAHKFISELPKGYDTLVGERGAQLSGGQKQRIAIARALVRNPRVLLLDEATSALDTESEGVVQEALDKAGEGRTTITIAHRLSTIRNSDKIFVIEAGRITASGTHSELMQAKGTYFDLVMAQTFEDPGYGTGSATQTEHDTIEEEGSPGEEQQTEGSESAAASKSASAKRRAYIRRRSKPASDSIDGRRSFARQDSQLPKPKLSRMLTKPQFDTDTERLKQEIAEEQVRKTNLAEIFREGRAQWLNIFIGLIGAALRGVVMPAFALFYSNIFQAYTKTGDELIREATLWSLMFLAVGAVQFIGSTMSIYYMGLAGENFTMSLRLQVFRNILRQDGKYFDDEKHATGKLVTRLATDASNVKSALDFRFATVLSSVLSMVCGIIIGFIYGWQMALFAIALLPFLGLASFINIRLRTNSAQQDSRLMEEAGKVAAEGIENVKTVQSLTREETFFDMFARHLKYPYENSIRHAHIHGFGYGFAQSMMFFMYAAAYRFGAFLVSNGNLEPLNVYKVFFAVTFSAMTIGWATAYFPEYAKARMSGALVFKMLAEQPAIDSYSEQGVKPEVKGKISFNNVHFAYPTRPDLQILKGFNLEVEAGTTVALVGPSGCGKSTTVLLMERFYDPWDGSISIDGTDIRTMNISHLRDQISIVSQEPILFDTTIRENIAYGVAGDMPHEKIVEAAKMANIHDFILGLPEGYNTKVGEKGTQLSGGQKQRVAIARALIRQPKILLLDEATSALDTESEKIVQDALDKARLGRTCVTIAHRLSTVKNADKIAVLKQGLIVEQGSHQELMSQRGLYYSLVQKQNMLVDD